MKLKAFLFISFLIGIDVLTKIYAIQEISPLGPKGIGYPYGGIGLFQAGKITLSFNLVTNTGAAWGIFQGGPGWLFAVRVVIIFGLIFYTFSSYRLFSRSWPLWLIVGGAIGNGIDYIVYGHVIDFIHFCFWGHSFAIFNFADSCISIGVILLLLFPNYFSKERGPLE